MFMLIAKYSRSALYKKSDTIYEIYKDGWVCRVTASDDNEAIERFSHYLRTPKKYIEVIA